MNIHVDGPPASGVGRIKKAFKSAGVSLSDPADFRILCVKHPFDWLASFFDCVLFDLVEEDSRWSRLLLHANTSTSFSEFVEKYLKDDCTCVAKVFDSYTSDSVMRIEDFPWNVDEFLHGIGHPHSVLNFPGLATYSRCTYDELKRDVVRKECELCERFDYYG